MSESLLFSDVLMDVQAAFSDADFKITAVVSVLRCH